MFNLKDVIFECTQPFYLKTTFYPFIIPNQLITNWSFE